MNFHPNAQHYFRFQSAGLESANRSSPGEFYAWSRKRPAVRNGDYVWVLARKGITTPGVYLFAYVFRAEGDAIEQAGTWQLHGVDGKMLEDAGFVQDLAWFAPFFKRMGNGGTGIQAIPSEYLPMLLAMAGDDEKTVDLEGVIDQAEADDRRDDVVALRAIKTRRGQAKFREALLRAYEGRCCISGCSVEPLLEAAHITAHSEATDYRTTNGLLLRADLHTLFDFGLLGIEPSGRVRVSASIRDLQYRELEKIGRIRPPRSLRDNPSEEALGKRMDRFIAG